MNSYHPREFEKAAQILTTLQSCNIEMLTDFKSVHIADPTPEIIEYFADKIKTCERPSVEYPYEHSFEIDGITFYWITKKGEF